LAYSYELNELKLYFTKEGASEFEFGNCTRGLTIILQSAMLLSWQILSILLTAQYKLFLLLIKANFPSCFSGKGGLEQYDA